MSIISTPASAAPACAATQVSAAAASPGPQNSPAIWTPPAPQSLSVTPPIPHPLGRVAAPPDNFLPPPNLPLPPIQTQSRTAAAGGARPDSRPGRAGSGRPPLRMLSTSAARICSVSRPRCRSVARISSASRCRKSSDFDQKLDQPPLGRLAGARDEFRVGLHVAPALRRGALERFAQHRLLDSQLFRDLRRPLRAQQPVRNPLHVRHQKIHSPQLSFAAREVRLPRSRDQIIQVRRRRPEQLAVFRRAHWP